ncbi:MAG: hypothetical protein ACOX9R_15930 [Armatimonadota bacterium]
MRPTLALAVILALTCVFACAQEDAHPGWEPEPGDLDPEQNIALGKTVSFAPAPNYRLTAAEDTDPTDLTDGVLSDHPRGHLWFQSKCVGWSYGGRANLALDLGEVEPIREIAIRIQGGSPQSGIATPVWMAAVVSDDGETWRRVGEYSTFRHDDDERFGVPRYEGTAWVHRFRFDDLQTRGRHVGLSLYGAGLTVADEMYVFRGEHDPDAVDLAALPVMDFSVTRPQMHLHKPYLAFTPNVTTPTPVGMIVPPDFAAEDVVVTMELPPGVELRDGGGFGRGDEEQPAEPLSEIEGQPVADGWTRYEWAARASGSTKTWGRLFITGDWEDEREGEMRYRLSFADGSEAPLMAVPLRAIEVPEAEQPEQLVVGLSWYSLGAVASWPDGLGAFRHLGLNTVSGSIHWIRDREAPANAAQWETWERAREEGFRLLNIDSTFHRMPSEPETRCQLPDGTVGSRLCPSYRGEYYQGELDRVSRQCAMALPDYLFADIELWSWRGPTDAERCTRCQADFAESGFETLEEWQLEKGFEMWRDVVVAVDAGVAGAGGGPVEFGVYDWVPGSSYQFTWPFDRFYPDYLQSAQPSTYTPLYWYHIELVGNEARHSRELLPRSDLLPWITPGDAGTFDGERFRYALLECFCNGARGMNFWSGRVWDAELLAAYSRVIRNLQPVEDLLISGELLEGAELRTAGRISGVTADGEMVILVADYHQEAGGAVTVTLPTALAMTATDLDTGETLEVSAAGELTVPLEGVRARVLHVR